MAVRDFKEKREINPRQGASSPKTWGPRKGSPKKNMRRSGLTLLYGFLFENDSTTVRRIESTA